MSRAEELGCRIAGGADREADLAADGWIRRVVAAPPRLDEVVELYGTLGHEVRVEPLDVEGVDERCAGCAPGLVHCRVIYTRAGPAIGGESRASVEGRDPR